MWVNNLKLIYIIKLNDTKIIKVMGYIAQKDKFEYMLKLPSGNVKHRLGTLGDMSKDIIKYYGSMESLQYVFKIKDIKNNKNSIEFGSLSNIKDVKRTFLNLYRKQENVQFAY